METLTYIATAVCVLLFIYIIFDAYNAVSDEEHQDLPPPSMDTIPDASNNK